MTDEQTAELFSNLDTAVEGYANAYRRPSKFSDRSAACQRYAAEKYALLAEVKRLRERVAELEANAAGYPTVAEHEAAMERARLSMQAAPDPNRMAAWRDTGKGYRA